MSAASRLNAALLAALTGLAAADALAQTAPAPAELAASTPVTTAAPTSAVQSLVVRLPPEPLLRFRGVSHNERSQGAAGNMMYGPGAAGFIVALITHAAVNDSVRSAQRQREEAAADRVLAPYRPVMDQLTTPESLTRALDAAALPQRARVIGSQDVADADWALKIAPLFWMTPDHRALMLEAEIAVTRYGDTDPTWQRRVRLFTPSVPAEAFTQTFWLNDDGRALREATTELLARAYRLAMEGAVSGGADAADAVIGDEVDPLKQRTVRFWEGGVKRFERVAVLRRGDCGWALLRNLRGELMSVSLVEAGAPPPLSTPGARCVRPEPPAPDVAESPAAQEVPAAPATVAEKADGRVQ